MSDLPRQAPHKQPQADHFYLGAVHCSDPHECDSGADCHYRVAWKINPHMQTGTHPLRAQAQWLKLRSALQRAGATVETLPFVHGAFDSVFVKDSVLVQGQRALLAHPRHAERRAEMRGRQAALEAQGLTVTAAPSAYFEAGDVVMLPNGAGALLGCGARTERPAVRAVEQFLGVPVFAVPLKDPRLFHLDLAVNVLSDGTALVCAEALGAQGLPLFEELPGVERLCLVPLDEALAFTLNFVEVGEHVIAGSSGAVTEWALSTRGRKSLIVELSEFYRAGGGAACLVSRRHVPARAEVQLSATQARVDSAQNSARPQ